ncbi:hypothetical protein BASA50_009717 [Batrachochytrium salamandrivorans]|uniref:NADP-dependent oxidoreductase domain-containing protein n=1 Tax=Batrachochytrium salamandrivorans TaxID=1357716 RepID=A0ABQ8F0P6_9FUNG|nr:hypothetical protein BASA60_007429 [Batrachochytrium salamandrivorans]KAH6590015.1 hypothetical protein BASA50_009717 [Batrachochytrium salamandrivorans]KAH9270108.1 hypothetical protein BASA83_007783 [Batrachochytrium salamandrivorans]KAJ1336420.1 hypothetical protein BSLG_007204 [Batrachochytrium salamandrivorans]
MISRLRTQATIASLSKHLRLGLLPSRDPNSYRSRITVVLSSNHFSTFDGPTPTSLLVSGSATPEGCGLLQQQFPKMGYAVSAKTGLALSAIGFGGYRVRPEFPSHKDALLSAFRSGVNVVDTSSHFGGGLSELLIGDAIQEAVASNQISRDQIVVVTKAGFVHGHSKPFHDQINTGPNGLPHCISPQFLEAEIIGSLERLKLDCIDTFLINSPERMLLSTDRKISKSHLYDMMARAFEALESQIQLGRIKSYGVASSSMHLRYSPSYFSIEKLLDLAPSSNFSTVQVPFNLFELDAMMETLDGSPSLFQICRERDLFVLANRPFYSICRGQIRLLVMRANINPEDEPALTIALSKRFEVVTNLEFQLADLLGVTSEDTDLLAKFVWAQVIAENLTRLCENGFSTERFFDQEIKPSLHKSIALLEAHAAKNANADGQIILKKWMDAYQESIYPLMDTVLIMSRTREFQANKELNDMLATLVPKVIDRNDTLATNTLRIGLSALAISVPASSMLVGMRLPEYVDCAVNAASKDSIDEDSLNNVLNNPIVSA